MASLSVTLLDDAALEGQRVRMAGHGVSMKQVARRIPANAVPALQRIGDLAGSLLGTVQRVDAVHSSSASRGLARLPWVLALILSLGLPGCATTPAQDPLQVTVAGIAPQKGEGMELRLLVQLRVQNPNDAPIDYNGIAVEMIVQGKTFATGVSDAHGSVPRFGEVLVDVPVTASAFRMARQAIGMMHGTGGKISYELKGKLNGAGMGSVRFQNTGDFEVPTRAGPET